MSPAGARSGLQAEIVTTLAAVVLVGLGVVGIGMTAMSIAATAREASDRLRLESRQLERSLLGGPGRLADLAALVRALPDEDLPSQWWVVDAKGRVLGRSAPDVGELPMESQIGSASGADSSQIHSAGLWPDDVVLVRPILDTTHRSGVLVGRVQRRVLIARALPILGFAAWGLSFTAVIFLAVGAWILRRRIVLPLRTLQGAASQIAHGNLETRVGPDGADELAELGRDFDRMAESLARERSALVEAQRRVLQNERLAAAGRLASGIAHEVGNPLAAILSYAEITLRDAELSDRAREAQQQLRDEALRVRTLIRELLDLARSSRVDVRSVEPRELLDRVAARLRTQPLLAPIPLVVETVGEVGAAATDPGRLEQILVNLVENAAHALAGQSDPEPCVRLRARPLGSGLGRRHDDVARVAVDVIDNGPGIDPDTLPHVFEPFFTTKEPGEGTGLGLWNAHRVVELLGGQLEVESRPGCTTFSLLLPAADTPTGRCADDGS